MKHAAITEQVIGCAFEVHKEPGGGFLEVKARTGINSANEAQLLNYLRASGIEVGLLIDFGKSVEVRRRIV